PPDRGSPNSPQIHGTRVPGGGAVHSIRTRPSAQPGSNVELVVLEGALHGLLADLFFAYRIWLHETRLCAAYSRRVGNAGKPNPRCARSGGAWLSFAVGFPAPALCTRAKERIPAGAGQGLAQGV